MLANPAFPVLFSPLPNTQYTNDTVSHSDVAAMLADPDISEVVLIRKRPSTQHGTTDSLAGMGTMFPAFHGCESNILPYDKECEDFEVRLLPSSGTDSLLQLLTQKSTTCVIVSLAWLLGPPVSAPPHPTSIRPNR